MTADKSPRETKDQVTKGVDVHPNGPSEDDEMDVLGSLYDYDAKLGVFFKPKFEV